MWSAEPKIFAVWPSQKKIANPAVGRGLYTQEGNCWVIECVHLQFYQMMPELVLLLFLFFNLKVLKQFTAYQ